jgi:hypothetical protein
MAEADRKKLALSHSSQSWATAGEGGRNASAARVLAQATARRRSGGPVGESETESWMRSRVIPTAPESEVSGEVAKAANRDFADVYPEHADAEGARTTATSVFG